MKQGARAAGWVGDARGSGQQLFSRWSGGVNLNGGMASPAIAAAY